MQERWLAQTEAEIAKPFPRENHCAETADLVFCDGRVELERVEATERHYAESVNLLCQSRLDEPRAC